MSLVPLAVSYGTRACINRLWSPAHQVQTRSGQSPSQHS
eukprot:SAG22_NODE_13611_length_400_cov_1.189369_1_plen_38_part_01